MVDRVKDIVEKDKVLTDVTGYNDWLSGPKVIGSRVIRVEIYFIIKTKSSLRDLVQSQIDFIQREELRIMIKRIGDEYTGRIGYLVGLVIDWANMNWYEEQYRKYGNLAREEIELKKDMVYKGAEVQRCIIIYGMRSIIDKVDIAMRQSRFSRNSHIKYVSLSNST